MTLTEFLLARIADDEAVARAAFRDVDDDGVWSVGTSAMDDERVEGRGILIYDESGHNHAQAVHIASHDPTRVLAECEAKRRIVELHDGARICRSCAGDPPIVYGERTGAALPVGTSTPCPTLRALALPHADHPDYRDEWRP